MASTHPIAPAALDPERDERPQGDRILVLSGATSADYQRMLEIRGDRSAPRISYLEGELEIMTPSQPHESIKSLIGRLVEVWCLERDVEFHAVGAWTLEDKTAERGVEPDESYIFGDQPEATRPDLAIEVVWTSGGLRKLEIYRKPGVREVWTWRRGSIRIDVLRGDAYVESPSSEVLAGIDLAQLAGFLDRPTTSAAITARGRGYLVWVVVGLRRPPCGGQGGRAAAVEDGSPARRHLSSTSHTKRTFFTSRPKALWWMLRRGSSSNQRSRECRSSLSESFFLRGAMPGTRPSSMGA